MGDKSQFWIGEPPRAVNAAEVIEALEAGEIDLTTPARILEDAPPRPLRKYLREIVWAEYQSARKDAKPEQDTNLMYRAAFDGAAVGMVVTDLMGRITGCNESFTRMLGYSENEVIGMRVGQIAADEDRTDEIALGNELFAGKRDSFTIDRSYRTKDGKIVPALLSVAMGRNTDGVPNSVIGQFVDLTEQKAMEAELSRSERLRTAGRLAGGVAHDFNNLLTVIETELNFLEEAEAGANPADKAESIQNIREATGLSSRLTQQLMAFSREGAVEVEVMDLNQSIHVLLPILRAALSGRATLKVSMNREEVLPVCANAVLVEQIIMNLVMNARNAMTKRDGEIHVSTRRVDESTVEVAVQDNGSGMSDEVKARAFEPFFTTREGSGGTGLGLATVYGIVERFEGQITLESEWGVGTTFRVRLPLADASEWVQQTSIPVKENATAAVEAPPSASVAEAVGPGILFVEDQVSVVRVVERLMVKWGYAVTTAGSVEDGVAAIVGASGPFSMLLCDLRLPDGFGTTVADAARERWPGIPVLHMSGYTDGSIEQAEILKGNVEFISKPFNPKDLQARIEAILSRGLGD